MDSLKIPRIDEKLFNYHFNTLSDYTIVQRRRVYTYLERETNFKIEFVRYAFSSFRIYNIKLMFDLELRNLFFENNLYYSLL